MTKKVITLLIVLVLAFTTVQFVTAQQKTGKEFTSKYFPSIGPVPAPTKKWRIGALEKTLINDFWMDLKNGYEAAAKYYGVQVDIYGAPSEGDILIQKQILDDMIAKRYDLICVSPITDTNVLAALKTATDRKIPVINVCDAHISSDAQAKNGIKIASFITTDFAENARLATGYAAELIQRQAGGSLSGKSFEIMHIMGLPGGRAAEDRKRGYLEKVAEFPFLNDIGVWPGDWDRKKSMDVAADVIQSHPNLRAIIGANDTTALGAYQAVKNAGKTGQILVAGIDAIPDAIQSVMNGELICTVPFMQYQMAYTAVEVAIQILEKKADVSKIQEVNVNQEVWHKDNMKGKIEEYREQFTGLKSIK